MTVTLVRHDLPESTLTPEERQFDKDCKEILGCGPMHPDSRADTHDLRAALKELGIKPFTKESVDAYMAWRAAELDKRVNGKCDEAAQNVAGLLAVAATVLAAVCVGTALACCNTTYVVSAAATSVITGILAVLAFYGYWREMKLFDDLMKEIDASRRDVGGVVALPWMRLDVGWRKVDIKGSNIPIPEFVLQTALDVARKCPSARLSVLILEAGARFRSEIARDDPFLIVSDGIEDHYLEVWDEPAYKQQREM